MAARNPYSRRWHLPALVLAGFVPVGLIVACVLANPPSTYNGCPLGDASPIYLLRIMERTPTDLVVLVNATSFDRLPLSMFSVVLSLNGRSVAELAPLVDGASNGSLGFHDVTVPGYQSKGDRFTVSLLGSGAYWLDLMSPRCDRFVFARAMWTV